MRRRRILIVNPNSSPLVTEILAREARRLVGEAAEIDAALLERLELFDGVVGADHADNAHDQRRNDRRPSRADARAYSCRPHPRSYRT